MSRLLGLLAVIATVCTAAATLLGYVAPEYAVYAVALGAAISAFTERIQGGASFHAQDEPSPSRGIAAGALAANLVATGAATAGAIKPQWAIPVALAAGLINSVTERVHGGVSR